MRALSIKQPMAGAIMAQRPDGGGPVKPWENRPRRTVPQAWRLPVWVLRALLSPQERLQVPR